jgi:predicted transcriptional regulator
MIEEIIDYILNNKVVSKKEIIKKFDIDEKFLDYIISYANKKGYKIKKEKNQIFKCSSCPYKKYF